jgi:hypothetical protein
MRFRPLFHENVRHDLRRRIADADSRLEARFNAPWERMERLFGPVAPDAILDRRIVLREGFAAAVTDTVARTTGRPPRTLPAFAAEHAARFGRAS